jgi:carbon starvation protein
MNLLILLILSIILLFSGYVIYGRFLSRWFNLNEQTKTPANQFNDNIEFIPTNKYYLLGQHLSAIAAAGPIVGPILAGTWFGWAPTFIWIILGGIFIGGVHDFGTLVASLRHQGKSIAEVIKETIGQKTYILFLFFLWFSLVYIITAFSDITASTFAEATRGSAIASSSILYLILALVMGIILKYFPLPLSASTLIFFPLVLACVYLGPIIPVKLPPFLNLDLRTSWNFVLLAYCFLAAVIPVWLLLQPRGYLGGFFLLLAASLSFLGIVIGNFTQHFTVQYPAFQAWSNPQGLPLVPLLFTTVACGACSGFHCLISSGTTSKQIANERDAKFVAYGGMLLESFVAVIALSTLMILSTTDAQNLEDPNQIYANGIATFLNTLGIPKEFALNFALLAFATFVFDTLDVTTRLGRYVLEELTGWKNKYSAYAATLATLILPAIFITQTVTDANGNVIPGWKAFWTVFGASNQLLAAVVLLGISLWMYLKRMKFQAALFPSIFMTFIALSSLFLITQPWLKKILNGKFTFDPMAVTSATLIILALFLIKEGISVFLKSQKESCPR